MASPNFFKINKHKNMFRTSVSTINSLFSVQTNNDFKFKVHQNYSFFVHIDLVRVRLRCSLWYPNANKNNVINCFLVVCFIFSSLVISLLSLHSFQLSNDMKVTLSNIVMIAMAGATPLLVAKQVCRHFTVCQLVVEIVWYPIHIPTHPTIHHSIYLSIHPYIFS